jgi:hypothetical protein
VYNKAYVFLACPLLCFYLLLGMVTQGTVNFNALKYETKQSSPWFAYQSKF